MTKVLYKGTVRDEPICYTLLPFVDGYYLPDSGQWVQYSHAELEYQIRWCEDAYDSSWDSRYGVSSRRKLHTMLFFLRKIRKELPDQTWFCFVYGTLQYNFAGYQNHRDLLLLIDPQYRLEF